MLAESSPKHWGQRTDAMPFINCQSASQTSNRDAYRETFIRHVHRLLQLGYESVVPTRFTDAEEDEITGELCKRMKQLTEEEPSENWMARYAVHDQDPVNKVLDEKTGKMRRGKRRPKLDIRLVNKGRVPNTRFCVEAKRLYRGDSAKAYVKDEGMGAFIGEYYAKGDDGAGMLGYIQTDSIVNWVSKLKAKLSEELNLQKYSGGEIWQLMHFRQGPLHTYRSLHKRPKSGLALEVYHTFFVFC
jgi:hypothetical protein